METTVQLFKQLEQGEYDKIFGKLYPHTAAELVRERYMGAVKAFEELFGKDRPALLISAPGRTEVGGNHTDHQRGRVLAAAVDLDIVCVVSPNGEGIVRIQSEGYPMDVVKLDSLEPHPGEKNTAAALIRGVAAWFDQRGYPVAGFDAYTTSAVLKGSGLSSSAAFEVAVGNMFSHLFCDGGVSDVEIAQAGQYAENVFFGKPSGLMDQMASSVGGFVEIDFADPEKPVLEKVSFRLEESGYSLCIVDTKGDHADLTGEYAAIVEEMGKVSALFGKQVLREVNRQSFYRDLARVRREAGDRAALRAIHFFEDDRRVPMLAQALRDGDMQRFLRLIVESGESSFTCLQNVMVPSQPQRQGLSLALALSGIILRENGGWRVHGGGFAGTIQAFVPVEQVGTYKERMESLFGSGACYVLSVRPVGGVRILPDAALSHRAYN